MNIPWRQMRPREQVRFVVAGGWRASIPPLTVALAILLQSFFPLVTTLPLLPELGLPLLVAWRVYQPVLLPVWVALPLGIFADIVLVQPVGIAAVSWPLVLIAVDFARRRLPWATLAGDWGLAAFGIVLAMLIDWRMTIFITGGGSLTAILPRTLLEILCVPLAARVAAAVEWRLFLLR
jgi:rod shape-determining protein MreD